MRTRIRHNSVKTRAAVVILICLAALSTSAQVAPTISSPPGMRLALPGSDVVFAPQFSGSPPLTFQWTWDESPVAGGTNSWLKLNSVHVAQNGAYGLVITNNYGSATGLIAQLTVLPDSPPTVAGGWGLDDSGQLFPPTNLLGFVSIKAGSQHVVALAGDGSVVAWGNNTFQQLNVPRDLTNATAVAAGGQHSLAVRSDGTVTAWGDNSAGQTAVPVGLSNAVAVAAGDLHTLVLTSEGSVLGWGDNTYGQCSPPTPAGQVVAVSAGGYFSAELLQDGRVIAWGYNGGGQTNVPASVTNATAIAAGFNHCLALLRDGSVTAWGYNGSGQTSVPANVSNVVAIAAGFNHSLALRSDGTVIGWGGNFYGQASPPQTMTNLVAISAGNSFNVGITPAPVIRTQPVPQLLVSNASTTFSVNVASALPPGFQWLLNGNAIAGATNSAFTLPNPVGTDAGYYSVIVSNDYGAVGSSTAVLSAAPSMTAGPTNQIAQLGENVQFSVAIASTAPVTYQWLFKSVNIFGANAASFVRSNAQPPYVGDYRVRITSSVGSATSGPVWLSLVSSNQNVRIGGALSLSITSSVAASFQWQFATTNLLGQTNHTLNLTNLQAAQSGAYRVLLDDGVNNPLTSPDIAVTVFEIPAITNTPSGLTLVVGQEADFAVGASGTPPLSYQWFFNGARINGATNGLLAIPSVQFTNAGSYTVSVTNYAGSATSSGATLAVIPSQPTIISQPHDWVMIAGTNTAFSVSAVGLGPLAYQWQRNNFNLPGATNPILALTNVQRWDAGQFQVVVTNSAGSITSSIATLTVYPGQIGKVVIWPPDRALPTGLCEVVGIGVNLALQRDGNVVGWAGIGTQVPAGLPPLAAISGLSDAPIGLKNDGTVVAWGNDGFGGYYPPPGGLSNVVAIAKGNMALRSDGTVVGWAGMFSPLGVTLQSNVAAIALGSSHWVTLNRDGTVSAYGDNSNGQTNVPAGLSGVKAIACGAAHTLALRANGTVVAWGLNASGQCDVPPGLNDVMAIGCGTIHSLAVRSNGTVVAWGYDASGQCDVPAGLSNIVAVVGGDNDSFALEAVNLGISAQPTSITNMAGSNVSFSVTAFSSSPMSYQWFFNGAPIAGATNATLNLTNVQPVNAGGYLVQVTDFEAVCQSDTAQLVVVPWPFLPFPSGTTGQLVAWGRDIYGETDVPPGLNNVVAISSGSGSLDNFAYLSDGTIVRWGGGVGFPETLTDLVSAVGAENYDAGLHNNGTVCTWTGSGIQEVTNITGVEAISACGPGLALLTNGTVITFNNWTPLLVGVSNATAIAVGNGHALALLNDGTLALAMYSYPYSGQTPLPPGISNVMAIAAGVDHCLALCSNGTVIAWGNNSQGQCSVPVGLTNVIAVAAGGNHSLALRADHTIVPWGDSSYGLNQPPANLTNVIAITCGWNHNVALCGGPLFTSAPTNVVTVLGATVTFQGGAQANGPVAFQWYLNGTLIPNATNSVLLVTNAGVRQAGDYMLQAAADGFTASRTARLSFNYPPVILAVPTNAWAFPGGQASFQVRATNVAGLTYQWYHDGQILPGETNDTLILSNVQPSLVGTYIVQVSTIWAMDTNLSATLSVLSSRPMGSVVAWDGTTNVAAGLSGIVQVSGGGNDSVALRADGTVVEWDNATSKYTAVPTNVNEVIAIAAGAYHTIALRSDGTMVGWGVNYNGEASPPGISDAMAIAAGNSFSVALRSNGVPVVWGDGYGGVLSIPTDATNYVAIAAGDSHVLALRNDGTLDGWGAWTPPADLSNIVAIAAGHEDSMALRSDGQVFCWGFDLFGQTNVPPDLSNVVAIAVGYSRCVVLQSDGTVRGWGAEIPPSYLSNLVAIATGENTSLGIKQTGVFIIGQPKGATVLAGTNFALTVQAAGVSPLNYQWALNGTNIDGADGSMLAITNIQDTNAGIYTVSITSSVGQDTSTPAAVVVLSPPRIIIQPASQTILSGSNATFSVTATGTSPISYQWLSNGIPLNGKTATNLMLTNIISLTNFYQVWITNSYGAITSAPAMLAVLSPPVIQSAPADQNVVLNSNVSFAVSVTGTAPFAYQWKFDDGDILDATNAFYLVTNAQPGVVGNYRVVVTNAFGAVTSTPANLNLLPLAPTILTEPASQNVSVGSATSFAVMAAGAGPLGFKWRFAGSPLIAGTGATFTIANVQGADAGLYDVVVTNGFGAVTSAPALLQVGPNPNVVAWGLNDRGQTNVPMSLTNILLVSCGFDHSLALRADGTVTGWGTNDYGQLSVPVGLSNVLAVAAGYYHSLALRSDGTVVGWGYNAYGQAAPPAGLTNVVAIAAGSLHSLALKKDGTVTGWGYNVYGQASPPITLSNAIAVTAGAEVSLALKRDGTIVVWGSGPVDTSSVSNLVAVSGNGYNMLLLKADRTVIGWPSKTLQGPTNVTELSAGGNAINQQAHNLAILVDGTVTGWGANTYGQASPPAGLSNVVEIAAGYSFSVAIKGPEFISQPTNQTIFEGQSVSFNAEVYSCLPSMLQWQLNGTNIGGATSPILTLPSVQFSQWGNYNLVVSNRLGVTRSATALLTVIPTLPNFITSPMAQTAVPGGTAMFNAEASGVGSLTYQWRFNGFNIPGADGTNLIITSVSSNQIGAYSVVVSNLNGSVESSPVALSIGPADLIVDNPQAQVTGPWNVYPFTSGQYGPNYLYKSQGSGSAQAVFTPAIPVAGFYQVYEWHPQMANSSTAAPYLVQYNGGSQVIWVNQQITSGQWNLLGSFAFAAGSTGNVRISDAFPDAGRYVAADAVRFVFVPPPVILVPPQNQFVMCGGTADFSVSVASSTPLSYQWQKGSGNLPAATLDHLFLANVQLTDAGTYLVVVTNAGGMATSSAKLNVGAPVAISPSAGSATLKWAGPFVLQTASIVSGPYVDLPDATSPWTISVSNEPQRYFRLRLAPTPSLLPLTFGSGQVAQLIVSNVAGLHYAIEASTNLSDWAPLYLGTAPFTFPDLEVTNFPTRFYRAVWVP